MAGLNSTFVNIKPDHFMHNNKQDIYNSNVLYYQLLSHRLSWSEINSIVIDHRFQSAIVFHGYLCHGLALGDGPK